MPERMIKLTVNGIFDRQDIVFDFARSPFFLVGPNGTGKSTALKILHNVLTAQWAALPVLPFVNIEIDYDDTTGIYIDRPDFLLIQKIESYVTRIPRRLRGELPYPLDWDEVRDLLMGGGSTSALRGRRVNIDSLDEIASIYPIVAPMLNIVQNESKGKVLYFPTYRRVERDLGDLLQSADPFEDAKVVPPKIEDKFKTSGEVVGFGGQDISALLADTAKQIDTAARQALNEHSVRFLEALSKKTRNDTISARELIVSEKKTEFLLRRISSFSDLNLDMESVAKKVEQIRRALLKHGTGKLEQSQEMMLVYISELIRLFEEIDSLSSPFEVFATLLDKYFAPTKSVSLDIADNTITIIDTSGTEISIEFLSSGEKQIVAFLAFLLLNKDFLPKFIIIDEPELSLSVSWQKSLIADMMSLSGGAYLTAATHSPFIFERFSIENVKSLGVL